MVQWGLGRDRHTAPVYFTQEGIAQANERLRRLKEQLRSLSAQIRDEGDSFDEAEDEGMIKFSAIQLERATIEARIADLGAMLAQAEVIKPARATNAVTLGMPVRVVDLRTKRASTYLVVGPAEIDPDSGRISYFSPVGRALLGRPVGDVVVVDAPRGRGRLRIAGVGRSWLRRTPVQRREPRHRATRSGLPRRRVRRPLARSR